MRTLLSLLPLFLISCDLGAIKDINADCASVCAFVESCGATPPTIQYDGMTESTGSGGLDCAANCLQEDMRAYYGYSDCQLDCLMESDCETLSQCWDVTSDAYASYCLEGRHTTPVTPGDNDPHPSNGTNTGSATADQAVDNPAVEAAVEAAADAGFVINYGDTPPDINGEYHAVGQIDESSNARPVGSPINTTLCFSNPTETPDGTEITYCEDGVPGEDTAPVTGSGDDFTIYLEYPGQETILFSGTVDGAGNPTNVEALVVYMQGIDVWELSHTNWEHMGPCSGCSN